MDCSLTARRRNKKANLSNCYEQCQRFLGHLRTKTTKVPWQFPNKSSPDSIAVLNTAVSVSMSTAGCSQEHAQTKQGQRHRGACLTSTEHPCIYTTSAHWDQPEKIQHWFHILWKASSDVAKTGSWEIALAKSRNSLWKVLIVVPLGIILRRVIKGLSLHVSCRQNTAKSSYRRPFLWQAKHSKANAAFRNRPTHLGHWITQWMGYSWNKNVCE